MPTPYITLPGNPLEPEDLDAQAEAAAFDEADSLEVTDESAVDTVAIKEE